MTEISIFLDDIREAPEGYIGVETIRECQILLKHYPVEHLSLDHDLVSKIENGTQLVEIMVREQLFANRITIHSANSVDGKHMYRYLKDAQLHQNMPQSIKILLQPLPLYFIPPRIIQFYADTI
ncbi:hypothetical protein MM300_22850 [Evansella sp. LMS18]|uniref:cyclic-phosphate processing receiver domain-containing protein n=1 Tax=Evansella sp. LMS18 TaxID=2924033 RepID=UPI0020D0ABDF|nr:cyclic-phosphate processing receiver domain-containing protein [Evansella sp. LMS18]UTR10666.1 hypothetical protein MM300_22850 [Evansella sp. LMS18]